MLSRIRIYVWCYTSQIFAHEGNKSDKHVLVSKVNLSRIIAFDWLLIPAKPVGTAPRNFSFIETQRFDTTFPVSKFVH
jgi:hypothetical protein